MSYFHPNGNLQNHETRSSATLLAVVSFLLRSLGWRVREKRPLPLVETHFVAHAWRLLSDRTLTWYFMLCKLTKQQRNYCKGMRGTQRAQITVLITVSKPIMAYAVWRVPSNFGKTLDSNDQNQVADQRFSLKQWFVGGNQSRGLRKPGCGHCCGRRLDQSEFWPLAEVFSPVLISQVNAKRKENSAGKEIAQHTYSWFSRHASLTQRKDKITKLRYCIWVIDKYHVKVLGLCNIPNSSYSSKGKI